jgi:hypothetical protein
MAGERLSKITIRAALSRNDYDRGNQTREVRFYLANNWVSFFRGAYPYLNQYAVPDPDDVQEAYVMQAVTNLIAVVKQEISKRGAAYTVSDPRDAGYDLFTNVPQVDFDIEATTYTAGDLDFYSSPEGWKVLQKLSSIPPLQVSSSVNPANVYGSATGEIYLFVVGGNSAAYTFTWDDIGLVKDSYRLGLKAGKYRCTVADGSGASTVIEVTVKSDDRLDVTVNQTDTTITLTPTGGVGPYTYLWDDGPTTAERTGLTLGGTYGCLVSDAHGATRRVDVTLETYRYYWSQNPATFDFDAGPDYRLDPTTKPNLSFLCQVWVEPVYLSDVFVQVGPQLEQPADLTGRTTFEVSALLDVYLREHLPALTSGTAVERADSLFRRFYLKTAQKYGTPIALAEPLADERQHYVLLGGLSVEEAAAGNWFAYQIAAQPFLTWEPDNQKVLPDQPVYLYYQHLGTSAAFELWRRVYEGAASFVERLATVPSVRRLEVYCLRAGEGLLATASGFDVWVADPATGAVLSTVRHYQLDRSYYPKVRFFLYTNSLGGVSVLAATGDAKHAVEIKTEEAARPQFDALLGDTVVLDRTGAPTLSVASGKRRRQQVVADQDMLLSRRVTLLSGGLYWPGRVKAATFVVRDEAEGLASLAFDYLLPTQRHFSPRLPAVVVSGTPLAPIAGGEGAQP